MELESYLIPGLELYWNWSHIPYLAWNCIGTGVIFPTWPGIVLELESYFLSDLEFILEPESYLLFTTWPGIVLELVIFPTWPGIVFEL